MRKRKAGRLSGGEQQMVGVGRALMARPDLLAIDELSLGLAPLVVAELAEHLRCLNRERGTAVLLVEQEVTLAFDVCAAGLRARGGAGDRVRSVCRAGAERGGAPGLLRRSRREHGGP